NIWRPPWGCGKDDFPASQEKTQTTSRGEEISGDESPYQI
ncbi:hypothetical protein A2U01_0056962, partial [Trifolium medium]|nr:hypothetical protein [Trifolium medium]